MQAHELRQKLNKAIADNEVWLKETLEQYQADILLNATPDYQVVLNPLLRVIAINSGLA